MATPVGIAALVGALLWVGYMNADMVTLLELKPARPTRRRTGAIGHFQEAFGKRWLERIFFGGVGW